MKEISEKTRVTISLLIIILGGMTWLSTVYAEIKTNSSDLQELKDHQEKRDDRLEIILERVTRIEEILKRIDRTSRR